MIDDLGPVLRAQHLFSHGKAHGIGDALAKRACGRLNPHGMTKFGVARGFRSELPEILHLFQRHIRRAGEVEKRIKQH